VPVYSKNHAVKILEILNEIFNDIDEHSLHVSDSSITFGDGQNTDPWSMDCPNGLPLRGTISDEWCVERLRLCTCTARRMLFFLFRIAFSRHFGLSVTKPQKFPHNYSTYSPGQPRILLAPTASTPL